jgi:hypothetical protein
MFIAYVFMASIDRAALSAGENLCVCGTAEIATVNDRVLSRRD